MQRMKRHEAVYYKLNAGNEKKQDSNCRESELYPSFVLSD
jgi:hypothetical protein